MKLQILTLLAFAATAFAQTNGTATLVGNITDSSGAAMAGVPVKVLNTNTAFLAETVSSQEGSYYVPNLIPGNYQINIFDDTQEKISLYQHIDSIKRQFGEKFIQKASGFQNR